MSATATQDERPTTVWASGLCHIAAQPGVALCGAAMDVDERWCCGSGADGNAEPCGRRWCFECDERAAKL